MPIINGYLDWAEKVPGPAQKTNGGINPVHGITFHSAEGYENGLRANNASYTGTSKDVSWHLSNLKDGRMLQHYPFTAQCWHATKFNNFCVGMEHEGVAGQPLTQAQIANDKKVIAEIQNAYGLVPKRPTSSADLTATLWEHNEVVRLGGSGTACPSSRIPWDVILATENEMLKQEGNFLVVYNGAVPVWRFGSTDGLYPGRLSKNFGGQWFWLRTSKDGHAVWSSEEGD